MKQSNIMMGDLVSYNDNIMRVNSLADYDIIAGYYIDKKEVTDVTFADGVEPIPLTEEIVKAIRYKDMSFAPTTEGYMFYPRYTSYDPNIINVDVYIRIITKNGEVNFVDIFNKGRRFMSNRALTVDKLQKALRLCDLYFMANEMIILNY